MICPIVFLSVNSCTTDILFVIVPNHTFQLYFVSITLLSSTFISCFLKLRVIAKHHELFHLGRQLVVRIVWVEKTINFYIPTSATELTHI